MAIKNLDLHQLKIERILWKDVATDILSDNDKSIFENRKKAVNMYIDGYKLSDIQDFTGIHRTKIASLVERCFKIDEKNGESFGYIALLPYKRLNKYTRTKESQGEQYGFNGSFDKLLNEYPSLNTFIIDNLFKNPKETLEKNITPTILHRKFLAECARVGIKDYEYPFNTSTKAGNTFRKHIKKLLDKNESLAIKRESNNAIQKFNSTGKGKKYSKNSLAPFNTVQLDGHKIDIIYSYEIENKNGEFIRNTATRCWLIAVVDVATRVILGYCISPHENYNQTDVLTAIQDSIMPKIKKQFSLPGFTYDENGGYYSLALPEISWALFDNIMLDNAKSHLAKDVVDKLCNTLKCSINFGSVATPETRGIVERMFQTLEENGYHRIVSTTGSNIFDTKRKNAETDAIKYNVTLEDIEEMTEYFISIYNNNPHSGLDNETPLQCMKRRIYDSGMYPCIAQYELKKAIENLTNRIVTRIVRGSFKSGKRPYIYYLGVEYRSDIISNSMDMIGEKVLIEINPNDISYLKIYLIDGSELGIINASGEWGIKPHSIKTRREVVNYARENGKNNVQRIAVISEYEEELRKRAKSSKRAGTKAYIVKKEQKNTITYIDKNQSRTSYDSSVIPPNDTKEINTKTLNTTVNESYSDEIEELLLSMSIEEAYEKGLL